MATADETIHRRIALSTLSDLSYLKHRAARSAQAKLDLHLPLFSATASITGTGGPSSSSASTANANDMRKAVEDSVRTYIETMFALARPSVSVAGLPADSLVSGSSSSSQGMGQEADEDKYEYEPYDTALADQIAALHARIETLNGDLAQMRRSVVTERAADFKQAWVAQQEQLDALSASEDADTADASGAVLEQRPLRLLQRSTRPAKPAKSSASKDQTQSVAEDENMQDQVEDRDEEEEVVEVLGGRQDEVARTWHTTLEQLRALRQSLGDTRTAAEQASKVAEYLGLQAPAPAPAPAPVPAPVPASGSGSGPAPGVDSASGDASAKAADLT